MIPKETTPLTKAVRTTEGVLIILSDVVLVVAASPLVHGLAPGVAAAVVGAQHIALLVQRGVIKERALGLDTKVEQAISDPAVLEQVALNAVADPTEVESDLTAIADEIGAN